MRSRTRCRMATTYVMIAWFSGIPISGQDTIPTVFENPTKPAARDADRIVELKEVIRITDEKVGFILRNPVQIEVGPGRFHLVRKNYQLLKFDSSGKFLRDYFRKGQGPDSTVNASGLLPSKADWLLNVIYPGSSSGLPTMARQQKHWFSMGQRLPIFLSAEMAMILFS